MALEHSRMRVSLSLALRHASYALKKFTLKLQLILPHEISHVIITICANIGAKTKPQMSLSSYPHRICVSAHTYTLTTI
jgi:hypothetical protein